jgi:deoxyadenosine/deoxycytidine kinase
MHYDFIAIEGNIGAGKTSLATKIAEQFNAKLILEQFEENLFLSKFYENPDKYAFNVELSFLAERFQQLTNQLSNRDLFASFTISDYFFNKCLIFAKANLKEDEFSLYSTLFHIIHAQLPKPDLLVYLYLNTERLKANIEKRGRSYEQKIEALYLEKVQQSYFDYIRQQPNQRILIIDINNLDFVANESDYKILLDAIQKDYPNGITRLIL